MAVWLVRAGRRGEREQAALDNSLVAIGWSKNHDLSKTHSREALAGLYRQVHRDASPAKVANDIRQVWAFWTRVNEGDLTVGPLHIQSAIANQTIWSGSRLVGGGRPRRSIPDAAQGDRDRDAKTHKQGWKRAVHRRQQRG